ncbi:MAG TPA: 30S ribosomal protein S18 [Candidatus Paceibacterota bacterium]|nr:30S ribosomal protein S18 [Candidatus Paceibacterota bacterium]
MHKNEENFTHVEHYDYKDIELLKKFVSPHGKIMPRKRTGVPVKNQRQIAEAIKRARFMGLLPYLIR